MTSNGGGPTRPGISDVIARFFEAVSENETAGLPQTLVRGAETFALRVRGGWLTDEHFRDGDIVFLHRTASAQSGQMILALIDGAQATVRTWHSQDDGMVRLESASPGNEPLLLSADRVAIQGHVLGVLRKY